MPSTLFVAVFSAWAALSVINQFSSLMKHRRFAIFWRIKGCDYCSLIPLWTFFAPNPATRDYEVLYRDQLVDGEYTAWRQLYSDGVPWLCGLWNPLKRVKKANIDMTQFVAQELSRAIKSGKDDDARGVFISLPYIGLATRVTAAPRGPLSARTQFMVALSNAYSDLQEPDILFISPLFELN
jgi:hypothetical protein